MLVGISFREQCWYRRVLYVKYLSGKEKERERERMKEKEKNRWSRATGNLVKADHFLGKLVAMLIDRFAKYCRVLQ